MKTGIFQRYDYGVTLNPFMYKQNTPPLYNLDNFDIPVYYFAGVHD